VRATTTFHCQLMILFTMLLSSLPLSWWLVLSASHGVLGFSNHRPASIRTRRALADATIHSTTFESTFELPFEKLIVKRKLPWKARPMGKYEFHYEYNELVVGGSARPTTGVLLIPPIGVGIGRWYYDRLLEELAFCEAPSSSNTYAFLAPDLLGSASACNPKIRGLNGDIVSTKKLPLFTVEDWSTQLIQLMKDYQYSNPDLKQWCVVANGGCVTIGLNIAQQEQISVTQLILSAPPRIAGMLRESPNPRKLQRTYYRTLLGPVGKIFWWYSLRNNGTFIQTFSEKNLAASSENLGPDWRTNCVETARAFDQKSKHSTFAFLAGALQRNCEGYLDELVQSGVRICVILPRDDKPNDAKSWVWQNRKKTTASTVETGLSAYLERKGLGGLSCTVGGRRCLAHEDAAGYANALLDFLEK
jgi:hypothetical protein